MPPQSCIAGITLPGGTTLLGATTAPFSTRAPSKITLLWPIRTSSSMTQEYKVQLGYIWVKLPIYTIAGNPLGKLEAVVITEFSPITLLQPILKLIFVL